MQNQRKPDQKVNRDVNLSAPRQKTNIREKPHEIGGPKGPEPTRYGDWERRGRCIDF